MPKLAIPAEQDGAQTQSRKLDVLKARKKRHVGKQQKYHLLCKVSVVSTAHYSQRSALSTESEQHLEEPRVVNESVPSPQSLRKYPGTSWLHSSFLSLCHRAGDVSSARSAHARTQPSTKIDIWT